MKSENPLAAIDFELRSGIAQTKCKRCGCMRDALQELGASLSLVAASAPEQDAARLLTQIEQWQQLMEPMQYT